MTIFLPEIETDPDTLAEDGVEFVQSVFPNWQPNPLNLDYMIIRVVAQMMAEARDLAADVPIAIFRWFGLTVIGLPPINPAGATASAVVTVKDDAGYTIEEGTVFGIARTGDDIIPFEVEDDVVIAPGATAGVVSLRDAREIPDADGNGLDANPELIDSIEWIVGAVLQAPTSGGVTGETDEEYLDRLSERLRLLTPRPILPRDFAVLARDVAGVARAVALDGYDAKTDTYDNERVVSVAVIDEAGEALSPAKMDEVSAYLESFRELNFECPVFAPTYTIVDVYYRAVAQPGYELATVKANIDDALGAYLSPANWGKLTTVHPLQGPEWINRRRVELWEIVEVINRAEGVDQIDYPQLQLNGVTDSVTLAGDAALPRLGVITGSVIADPTVMGI